MKQISLVFLLSIYASACSFDGAGLSDHPIQLDSGYDTKSLDIQRLDKGFDQLNDLPDSDLPGADFSDGQIDIPSDSSSDSSDDIRFDREPILDQLIEADVSITDRDNDGVDDEFDNCPDNHNSDQFDDDKDGIGDECDNCAIYYNPLQTNSDNDFHGDACDNCPNDENLNQQDSDGDLIGDVCDNCPNVANPNQDDQDSDKIGDLCDPDIDGDGIENDYDPFPSTEDNLSFYDSINSTNRSGFSENDAANWQDNGVTGPYCSSDINVVFAWSTYNATASPDDVLVQSTFSVQSVKSTGDFNIQPRAGVTLRFSADTSTSPTTYRYYSCVFEPNLNTLRFIKTTMLSDGTNIIEMNLDSRFLGAPPYILGTNITLRSTRKGDVLTCEVVGNPSSVITVQQKKNDILPAGNSGLFADLAQVCFKKLLIMEMP